MISKEDFQRGSIFKKISEDYILKLLEDNKSKAYSSEDVVKIVKKSPSLVTHKLSSLVKKGIVLKKKIDVGKRLKVPHYIAKCSRGRKKISYMGKRIPPYIAKELRRKKKKK